ncbi:MAG: hypothetical protein KIS92_05130 [Planctomycetota bacterium]|nr:hypothetical protein [Planctomycetota bacterium]
MSDELVVQVKTFDEAWNVFKTAQDKLSTLSKAFVEEHRTAVADVNGKRLVFDGIGYAHAEIGQLLKAVGAPFNPQYVHHPPPEGMTAKEYRLSVRYPWAQDRVM